MNGSKVKLFSYLKERMSKRISGWHGRTLSQGGKEVLIKAVASALPVQAMSVYRLPKTVISSLNSVMACFWWDNFDYKRKIHGLSWEKMCLSKEKGGMGFKDLECFNQVLLAKQVWRLIQFPDCLMSQVLKGKYFGDVCFTKVQLSGNVSYTWRSIIFGRELLGKGLRHSVGNGRSLKVWTEPSLEDEDRFCRPPCRRKRCFDVNLMVSDVIDFQERKWNRSKLMELFFPSDIRIL